MKSINPFLRVAAVLLVLTAARGQAQQIPPATAPVYLLAGMHPINPGQEEYKLVSWEDALGDAGVPAEVIAQLQSLEAKPFFGWERFKLGLTACNVAPQYFNAIKRVAIGHPHPNPRLPATAMTSKANSTFYVDRQNGFSADDAVKPGDKSMIYRVTTGTGNFTEPPTDAFTKPPGTNQLPNVHTNLFDGYGREMPHTLPSTKLNPYNLHDGEPIVTEINQTSPTDDLKYIYYEVIKRAELMLKPPPGEREIDSRIRANSIRDLIQRGIDIVEGNPLPDRAYSGFPLLHYHGPLKIKQVVPIYDSTGTVVGGNVDIHQIWYDNHIESDAALLNASDVWDVPWTMTYTIDVLARGHDDFSPFAIFTDDPTINNSGYKPPKSEQNVPMLKWKPQPGGLAHYGMDQSFFPMEDGSRTVVKIKMPPGKYFHLVYTWGWRMHPPRIQSTDRATKAFPDPDQGGEHKTLVKWETDVFGVNPMENRQAQVAAINKIGDLAPAKQMWLHLNEAAEFAAAGDYRSLTQSDAPRAFFDWHARGIMKLPHLSQEAQRLLGRKNLVDPTTDLTLLFVNNTIYGEFRDGGVVDFPSWKVRAKPGQKKPTLRITIYNGDNFRHAYTNVDFGGSRGWENQFKSSVQSGGSGCWFTFGRANWWVNNKLITLPPADPNNYLKSVFANVQKVNIIYNYEPSRRLRFYQFDPTHHDVCILSIH